MFFIFFAISIWILTLFLGFFDSEILIVPIIVIFSFIWTFLKFKKDKSIKWYKILIKKLFRWIVWNIIAVIVVSMNLYLKNPDYAKYFLWIQKIEFVTPEREIFNDFVRITDTQKYHKYYVEDLTWNVYLLNSEKAYHIGDQIFLSASKMNLNYINIFSNTWNTIFSSEFWNYEFNYDKWLFMKGVDGSLYEWQSLILSDVCAGDTDEKSAIERIAQDCIVNGKAPNFASLWTIDKVRARMQNTVISIFGENKYSWLLLWLLIGDKSMIPSDNYDTFVDSWLVHIIAVSGWNMAMVIVLLSFIFAWLPFYVRNTALIIWICLYALLCGSDASVFRAAVMWSLTLIALFRWREISIWRSMMYAFIAILIFNPFSLWYDIWFILSFSAIIWIVLFQKFSQNLTEKRLAQKSKVRWKNKKSDFFQCKFRNEYLVPTIWASLWTSPVLIFFMNGVNLVWILLNVFIVPIIPIVTIYGFCSTFFSLIIKWKIWIIPEKLFMNLIYCLSNFWAKYAIFVQSNELWKKYIFVIIFLWLWIYVWWSLYWKHKEWRFELEWEQIEKIKNKKNQAFDKVLEDL